MWKGDYPQSIDDLDQAVRLAPELAQFRYTRAWHTGAWQDEFDRAIPDFSGVIDQMPAATKAVAPRRAAMAARHNAS